PCAVAGGGHAFAQPTGFPWSATLHKSGKLTIKGTPKVAVTVEFENGAVCSFHKNVVYGNVPTPQLGVQTPVSITLNDQAFKLDKHASTGNCPASASISTELATIAGEGQVFETLVKS